MLADYKLISIITVAMDIQRAESVNIKAHAAL
jgi:hypothetical protein